MEELGRALLIITALIVMVQNSYLLLSLCIFQHLVQEQSLASDQVTTGTVREKEMINSPIRKSYLTYLKDLSDLDNVIKMYELEQRREKKSFENVKAFKLRKSPSL